jgi:hypothetical protein
VPGDRPSTRTLPTTALRSRSWIRDRVSVGASVGDLFPDQFGDVEHEVGFALAGIVGRAYLADTDTNGSHTSGRASKTLAPGVRLGWMSLPLDLVEGGAESRLRQRREVSASAPFRPPRAGESGPGRSRTSARRFDAGPGRIGGVRPSWVSGFVMRPRGLRGHQWLGPYRWGWLPLVARHDEIVAARLVSLLLVTALAFAGCGGNAPGMYGAEDVSDAFQASGLDAMRLRDREALFNTTRALAGVPPGADLRAAFGPQGLASPYWLALVLDTSVSESAASSDLPNGFLLFRKRNLVVIARRTLRPTVEAALRNLS